MERKQKRGYNQTSLQKSTGAETERPPFYCGNERLADCKQREAFCKGNDGRIQPGVSAEQISRDDQGALQPGAEHPILKRKIQDSGPDWNRKAKREIHMDQDFR